MVPRVETNSAHYRRELTEVVEVSKDRMGRCLAPDCDETFDTWHDAARHRKQADHGEVWH